jgi:hypothetical protein
MLLDLILCMVLAMAVVTLLWQMFFACYDIERTLAQFQDSMNNFDAQPLATPEGKKNESALT